MVFVLATLKDKVKVEPEFFQDDMAKPVISEIQRLYSNKVIADVGLCICVHQVLEMGDMYIYPNEGAAYIVTVFNMVVFRPFADEVLSGAIHSMDETGMKVSVGFFHEIFVPAHRLPAPHDYESGEGEDGEPGNPTDRKWVWVTEDGARLDMAVDDEVRVKVRGVDYHETRKDKYPKVSYDKEGSAYTTSLLPCGAPFYCPTALRSAACQRFAPRCSGWEWRRLSDVVACVLCFAVFSAAQLRLRRWSRTRRR